MRNRISILAALVLVAYGMFGAELAQATSYKTPGIRGTDHDFALKLGCYDSATGAMKPGCVPWSSAPSASGSVRSEDEICIFCHAPHNANTTVTEAPLWNHALTTSTYDTYVSPSGTMKATVGQPDGTSKLCLSCHDGTVAIDAYGTNLPGTGHMMGDKFPGFNTGIDLKNDHPISFTYDATIGDDSLGGLWNPETRVSHQGDIPANAGLPTVTGVPYTIISVVGSGSAGFIKDDMLKGGKVQCTSCHEPHNRYGWNKFLVKNNTGSALCLTCHNK